MIKQFVFILCVFLFNNVLADEVRLKNGSRLVGELLTKEGSKIQFKTPFAGTLKIKWENIVSIKTDKPTNLMLKNESIRTTNSLVNEGDLVKITNEKNDLLEAIKQSELVYINPDPWRQGKGYKTSGNLNISLKSQRGNTDRDEFDLDGVITIRRKTDRLTFRGEYEDDKSNDVQTNLNWMFLGGYDYFISDKTYLGGTILWEHDKFSDLHLRESYGLLLGHQYFESKAINLSVDAGLAQVYEDFIEARDKEFLTGTWGVKYDQYFFNDVVQLYHRQFGRFNLKDTDKFIFKSWSGLRFPLAFGFAISAELQADYDSQPAQNAQKTDTTYYLKLGYDF